jgi:hypothetical protein
MNGNRGIALVVLAVACFAMFTGGKQASGLVFSIAGRMTLIFVVIGVAWVGFKWLLMYWPSGIEGYSLFVGIFVLGFSCLLMIAPDLQHKQDLRNDEWLRKMNALRKFKEDVPTDFRVDCNPNNWDGLTITCRYVSDGGRSATGCFKAGTIHDDMRQCDVKK